MLAVLTRSGMEFMPIFRRVSITKNLLNLTVKPFYRYLGFWLAMHNRLALAGQSIAADPLCSRFGSPACKPLVTFGLIDTSPGPSFTVGRS